MGRDRRIFIGILSVSILLRLAMALYLGNEVEALPGTFDQISYHRLALRVVDGHGFSFGEQWWPATRADEPTAHWSFLYTLYLTAIYAVSGANPLVARLVQAVLSGILMPWLVYRIAMHLFAPGDVDNQVRHAVDEREAQIISLVAAAIIAVYAYFIYYAAILMTESFYFITILWAIDTAVQIRQTQATKSVLWLRLGLAMGCAVLLRQVFLLFVPFLLLWLWWSIRPRIKALLLPLVVIFMMMLPWMVRNYLVFDQFVLLNTNSGYAFFWGNHPIYGTKFIPILTPRGAYYDLLPPDLLHLNEAALDTALLKLAVEDILRDPGRYIQLSISRIPHYFVFWPLAKSTLIANLSRVASFGLFLPFMLAGLIQTLRKRAPTLKAWLASPFVLVYLFGIVYTGIHLLTWTLIRYRLPIDALLILFAALSLVRLYRIIEARHSAALT